MTIFDEVQASLSQMILSHSGWRGVFAACGGEEGRTGEISAAHKIIIAGAAVVFAEFLYARKDTPLVLIGSDTRPTGKIIAEIMISALLACGCQVRYAGIVAAPEIMAWARSLDGQAAGFIYISASHNPIGHNGLKFGLTDGGVLPAEEGAKLTANFRSFMADPSSTARCEKYVADAHFSITEESIAVAKKEAFDAYYKFSAEVAWGSDKNVAEALRNGIAKQPLGVCCDFNGSARCLSIDSNFLCNLGMQFEAINAQPGEIAHRIVPEGESLDPCCAFLEKLHNRNPAFIIGYVPDCDGDRGNLVIWDDNLQKARALEAQEVFALACVAELAQLKWGVGKIGFGEPQIAVAVNDPTSLRIDRIAAAFGASVFRAEVGEANVVGLARKLREKGYTVRILGEGSAGGNITHPSAVRDPIHTVLALAKLLSLRTDAAGPGLFELWCNASGQKELCKDGFSLAEIIASLPPFVTTSAYSPEAVLKISSTDHGALKSRYQKKFFREWEERKDQLKASYGIYGWEAIAYNGMEERKGIGDFGEAGKGGLKINFLNADLIAIASIWMRGSATEPVFRIMAEIEGTDRRIERDLIEWQRRMTMEADRGE
jgi:phosphoglucomutase